MEKKKLTRRTFVKKTSVGAAGFAIAASGISPFFAGMSQNSDKLALLGGNPVRPKGSVLGVKWPVIEDRDLKMYVDAFKNKSWSEHSFREDELGMTFQKQYAEFMGVKYCAVTNAGTNALEAAQRAFDIGPGDEVITQTNTFVATAQSTFNLFALPVLIDSDPETFMINTDLIEEHITPRTRAIIPVHIGGAAANMDKILAIAKRHNLAVIEDTCQAHSAEWRNKKLGTIGDLGCFSFQEFKSLSAGEGGAVIGNDEYLVSRVGGYVNNGRDPMKKGRTFPGGNFRPTSFQAANMLSQLKRHEEQNKIRDKNVAYLEKLLTEVNGVSPTKKYDGQTRRAYYAYQLIYDKEHFSGLPKARFMEALQAEGIPVKNGIDSNLHLDPFIEAYLNLDSFKRIFSKERLDKYRNEIKCPVNENLSQNKGIALYHAVFLGPKKDMDDIIAAILKIQKNASKLL
ncbi:MAG: DegT/DnrJ/EryC1/StrS family aminotransferase [Mariniphaga sp.]|nr:DegT/DnrJ/EryC1/StrS family aminotransferase [Mariniphaga sp.]